MKSIVKRVAEENKNALVSFQIKDKSCSGKGRGLEIIEESLNYLTKELKLVKGKGKKVAFVVNIIDKADKQNDGLSASIFHITKNQDREVAKVFGGGKSSPARKVENFFLINLVYDISKFGENLFKFEFSPEDFQCLVTSITHELIHAQQFAQKRLSICGGGAAASTTAHPVVSGIFEGVNYKRVAYEDAPWEKEAFERTPELGMKLSLHLMSFMSKKLTKTQQIVRQLFS